MRGYLVSLRRAPRPLDQLLGRGLLRSTLQLLVICLSLRKRPQKGFGGTGLRIGGRGGLGRKLVGVISPS